MSFPDDSEAKPDTVSTGRGCELTTLSTVTQACLGIAACRQDAISSKKKPKSIFDNGAACFLAHP